MAVVLAIKKGFLTWMNEDKETPAFRVRFQTSGRKKTIACGICLQLYIARNFCCANANNPRDNCKNCIILLLNGNKTSHRNECTLGYHYIVQSSHWVVIKTEWHASPHTRATSILLIPEQDPVRWNSFQGLFIHRVTALCFDNSDLPCLTNDILPTTGTHYLTLYSMPIMRYCMHPFLTL